MTAPTVTPPVTPPPAAQAPRKPAGTPKPNGYTTRYALHVIVAAIGSWVAGMALNEGWHIHAPWGPVYLLSLVGLLLADHSTALVAAVWHEQKIKAAPELTMVTKAAEHMIDATAPAILGPAVQAFVNSQAKQ